MPPRGISLDLFSGGLDHVHDTNPSTGKLGAVGFGNLYSRIVSA